MSLPGVPVCNGGSLCHHLPKCKMCRPYLLTKSTFIAGHQCEKRLYYDVHERETATPATAATQAVFDFGHIVGKVAWKWFPNGRPVPLWRETPEKALELTRALLNDPDVPAIYEGAFRFDEVFVRVDVLARLEEGGWHLIECKSTSRVKDIHFWDIAVQAYVLKSCGVPIRRCSVLHLNRWKQYNPAQGELSLLRFTDVSAVIQKHLAFIPQKIKERKRIVRRSVPPAIEPGSQCTEPYQCPYWERCTKDKPADWVGYLPDGAKQFPKLLMRGYERMADIPMEFPKSIIQSKAITNSEWGDRDLLRVMKRWRFPLHHLYVEAVKTGIPLWAGVRPFDPTLFQWTNLREDKEGVITQDQWIATGRGRPKVKEVMDPLLESLGQEGTILVYSETVPKLLEAWARQFRKKPRKSRYKAAVKALCARMVDLREVIRTRYYHPHIHYSVYNRAHRWGTILDVLPMLSEQASYPCLTEWDSGWASRTYADIAKMASFQQEYPRFQRDVLARSGEMVHAVQAVRHHLMRSAERFITPPPAIRRRLLALPSRAEDLQGFLTPFFSH